MTGEAIRPLINGDVVEVTPDDFFTVECVEDPPWVSGSFQGNQVGSILAFDNRERPDGNIENFPPFVLSGAETPTEASDFYNLPGEWVVTCIPYCARGGRGDPASPPRTVTFTVIQG